MLKRFESRFRILTGDCGSWGEVKVATLSHIQGLCFIMCLILSSKAAPPLWVCVRMCRRVCGPFSQSTKLEGKLEYCLHFKSHFMWINAFLILCLDFKAIKFEEKEIKANIITIIDALFVTDLLSTWLIASGHLTWMP